MQPVQAGGLNGRPGSLDDVARVPLGVPALISSEPRDQGAQHRNPPCATADAPLRTTSLGFAFPSASLLSSRASLARVVATSLTNGPLRTCDSSPSAARRSCRRSVVATATPGSTTPDAVPHPRSLTPLMQRARRMRLVHVLYAFSAPPHNALLMCPECSARQRALWMPSSRPQDLPRAAQAAAPLFATAGYHATPARTSILSRPPP